MVSGGLVKAAWPPSRRKAKEQVEAELKAYQADPEKMLGEIKAKFPTIHRVLIEDRNRNMAARIRKLAEGGHRRIVAVLGDGHIGGMLPLLADLSPKVFRLADVREGRLPRGPVATGTPSAVSFSFTQAVPHGHLQGPHGDDPRLP